jgi:uncharacterized protein YkwD
MGRAKNLVSGFAATQYYLYQSFQTRAGHSLSAQSNPKSAVIAEAPNPSPAAREPSWLQRANHWREFAGLAVVTRATELDAAAVEHARYLVKHVLEGKDDELDAGGAHREDPSDPWYTPTGLAAAQDSDVDPPCRNCMFLSASEHIDELMSVPFHRMNIFDPDLTKIGYGSYTEAGLQGAVLYLPVLPKAENTFTRPIEFPPDGSRIGLARFSSEWPDPLSSCPGYTAPTGLPIPLELGRWLVANVSDYPFKADHQTLLSCVFDASTYNNPDDATQARGRNGLKAYGAAVLIPRQPLASGQTYSVSISTNGKTYSWSFSVE